MGMIFDFIWHSVWAQMSLFALALVALGAVAWFIPPLRRWAIGAIILIAGAAFEYGKGAKDASDAARKREAETEKKAIESGQADRAAADADAASGVSDGGDRDK